MAKKPEFFVEPRPDGRFAASRPNAQRASFVADTQTETIQQVKQSVPEAVIHVARVKHTKAGHPDEFRNPS